MGIETAYRHIEKTDSEPARLKRTPRVRVTQIVLDYLAYGWSIDEMCRQHAYLSPAEAHAAMAYYFDHQEEFDEEIRKEFQESNEACKAAVDSPFIARLRAQSKL